MRVRAGPLLAKFCEYRYLQLPYSHAMSDLRVCTQAGKYNDPQLRVRVSSYSHVALAMAKMKFDIEVRTSRPGWRGMGVCPTTWAFGLSLTTDLDPGASLLLLVSHLLLTRSLRVGTDDA